jgi:hypothetical protein
VSCPCKEGVPIIQCVLGCAYRFSAVPHLGRVSALCFDIKPQLTHYDDNVFPLVLPLVHSCTFEIDTVCLMDHPFLRITLPDLSGAGVGPCSTPQLRSFCLRPGCSEKDALIRLGRPFSFFLRGMEQQTPSQSQSQLSASSICPEDSTARDIQAFGLSSLIQSRAHRPGSTIWLLWRC